MKTYQAKLRAPFAVLGIRTNDTHVTGIDYLPLSERAQPPEPGSVAHLACVQIDAYLDDASFKFDLPLKLDGTHHQLEVWEAMRRIPAGTTRTYGELAKELHSAPRAVGGACGRNPIPLVVPCHRIVGAAGIGGFMGGTKRGPLGIKRWLLEHEARAARG